MRSLVFLTIGLVVLFIASVCPAAQLSNGIQRTVESVSAEVAEFYNWKAPNEEFYQRPRVDMPYKVTTYVGVQCPMPHDVLQMSAPVMRFAWDYDSDGFLDWVWDTRDPAIHVFNSTGKQEATFYAFDTYGRYGKATITVEVSGGRGEPKMEWVKPADSFRQRPKKSRPAELAVVPDPGQRYFLLINDFDCDLYPIIQNAYHALVDTFGYDDSHIVVVTKCEEYPDDTVFIDFNLDDMDLAFNYLIDHMTYDDDLHILVSAHGSGGFDSSIAWYGDIERYSSYLDARPFYVFGAGIPFTEYDDEYTIDDPDLFCTEDEFPVAIPQWWNGGYRTTMVGMNQWIGDWTEEFVRRRMMVSSFDKVKFYSSKQPKSDDDEFIEEFVQFLKGDTNRNSKIEPELGEVWDYDGDGVPPIDTTEHGYVYDDDDWGDLGLLQDGKRAGFFYHTIAVFDAGLDGIPDICFNWPEAPAQPTVHGTDWDNDGLVIGMDCNRDGDMLDSAGVNEDITIPDNYWGDFLDVLEYRYVSGVFTNCFSGGVIDDMSRPNVLIATATTSGTVAWGTTFTHCFSRALTGGIPNHDFDPGEDRIVTFLDVYNYIDTRDYSTLEGRVRLDDNGDRVGHVFPLPNGGDGALAAELTWGTLPPHVPLLLAIPISPEAGDTLFEDLTPTFMWSDSCDADSFLCWVNVPPWEYYCFDTTFTIPDSDRFGFIPANYTWRVKSFKDDVEGEFCDQVTYHITCDYDCCEGMRGDLDGDGFVTPADLVALIEFVYEYGAQPTCFPEANVDAYPCWLVNFEPWCNEMPDAMDIDYLTEYLYNGGPPPYDCSEHNLVEY